MTGFILPMKVLISFIKRDERGIQVNKKIKILDKIYDVVSLEEYVKDKEVSYPVAKDENGKPCEGYQWFMNNRGSVNKHKPQFDQFLYTAKDGLFDNKKPSKQSDSKYNNGRR